MSVDERYHRQTLIKGWDQKRIREATVAIIGIGALGCEVSKNLALMGIGRLILVDHDVIELSNLNRQMLFSDSNIGQNKADVAQAKLSSMCPFVKIEGIAEKAQKIPLGTYKEVDVIVGGLDNWEARRWLNSVAIESNKPYIDGAAYEFWGNVQVVVPFKTACLECQANLLPQEILAAECTLRTRSVEDLLNDLAQAGIADLPRSHVERLFEAGYKTLYDIKYAEAEALGSVKDLSASTIQRLQEKLKPRHPMVLTVNAVIGAVQAHETLKVLHNGEIGSPIDSLLTYDASACSFYVLKLERNEECFICSDAFRLKPIEIQVDLNQTLRDLKETVSNLFGYPDVILQHRWNLLKDFNSTLSASGMEHGSVLFVHSRRSVKPKKIVLRGE